MTEPNMQPLRDLFYKWQRDLPHMDNGAANATQACLDELTAALNNLTANACDCTAGIDHIHTGEWDINLWFDDPGWELHSCGEWKLATATECPHCEEENQID